jgi:putative ABC transport system permease protein
MSLVHALRHRLQVLLRGRAYARDIAEEQRFHRELEAMQQGHGGSLPDEAQFASRRRFGNRTAYMEQTRRAAGLGILDWLRQDLRFAWRGIRRAPGLAVTVVATFAIGIGANAAIYTFIARVLLLPPEGVVAPEAVRRLWVQYPAKWSGGTRFTAIFSYPDFVAIRDGLRGTARVATQLYPESTTVARPDGDLPAYGLYVTDEYLPLLVGRPALGRFFTPDEDDPDAPSRVAVLSFAFWQRAFSGDPAVIGRTIQVAGDSYTAIGVAPRTFAGLDAPPVDLWMPLSAASLRGHGGLPWYRVQDIHLPILVRADDDVTDAQLAPRIALAYRAAYYRESPSDSVRVLRLGSILPNRGPGAVSPDVSIGLRLAGVALALLLIACANVANLLLIRALRRRREIAIRLALGVSRVRLVRQLLAEGLLLALFGGVAALVMAAWGGNVLRTLLQPPVRWPDHRIALDVVGFAIAIAILSGVVASLAPAVSGSRADVVEDLRGGAREGVYRRSGLRQSLLVLQAALSVVLLVGAGLCVRSLRMVEGIDVGYAAAEVLVASAYFPDQQPHPELADVLRAVASRARELPGAQRVSLSNGAPQTVTLNNRIYLPGHDSLLVEDAPAPDMMAVEPEFFATVGTRVEEGRGFTATDLSAGGHVAIVNRTMARRLWPDGNPIGHCVIIMRSTNPCNTIIGVVGDFRAWKLVNDPSMGLFVPLGQEYVPGRAYRPSLILVRAALQDRRSVAAALRSDLHARLPDAHLTIQSLSEKLDPQFRPWRVSAALFSALGILALLVSSIGIYSVIASVFSQRTHEMGVRMTLGASPADLVRLVLRSGTRVVGVGVLLGVIAALALGKLSAALLYQVSPRDPITMGAAALLLFISGCAASLLPALRAARVDPGAVLRDE